MSSASLHLHQHVLRRAVGPGGGHAVVQRQKTGMLGSTLRRWKAWSIQVAVAVGALAIDDQHAMPQQLDDRVVDIARG